jgi:hypothetical protein
MGNHSFIFEYLPNELLIKIFQYIDPRDLYHAFYNLNARLNAILQSPYYLTFTLSNADNNNNNEDTFFFPYIYTLINHPGVNVNLNRFINVRRLWLSSPTSNQLKQLESDTLPSFRTSFHW